MNKRLFVGFLILAFLGYLTAIGYGQALERENPGWLLIGGGMLHTGALLVVFHLHTKNLQYHYPLMMIFADLALWSFGFSVYKTASWFVSLQLTNELLWLMISVILIVLAFVLFYLSEPQKTVLRDEQKRG